MLLPIPFFGVPEFPVAVPRQEDTHTSKAGVEDETIGALANHDVERHEEGEDYGDRKLESASRENSETLVAYILKKYLYVLYHRRIVLGKFWNPASRNGVAKKNPMFIINNLYIPFRKERSAQYVLPQKLRMACPVNTLRHVPSWKRASIRPCIVHRRSVERSTPKAMAASVGDSRSEGCTFGRVFVISRPPSPCGVLRRALPPCPSLRGSGQYRGLSF